MQNHLHSTCLWAITLFIVIFSMMSENVLHAQDPYTQPWQRVQNLEASGLPRQALQLTDSIYRVAVKDNNDPQRVKAVIQRMRLLSLFSETHYPESIKFLQTEVQQTKTPLKQIFQSILAEVYWRYLREDMYQILERTRLESPGDDPQWWDAQTFSQTIRNIYLQSLEPAQELYRTPVRSYTQILDTAEGSEVLRPSLYDLLFHRAMEFLSSEDAVLGFPAFPAYPVNYEHFGDTKVFQALTILQPDRPETSLLSLYQQAEKLHLGDILPDAKVALELQRLAYVRDLAATPEGKAWYRAGLERLLSTYNSHPVSVGITWHLALDYLRTAASFDPLISLEGKWDRKQAYDLCSSVVRKFPAAFYSPHCKRLMQDIAKPGLWLSHSRVVASREESLVLLSYQNLKEAELRVIRMDPEEDRQLRQFQGLEELMKTYLSIPPVAVSSLQLKDEGDYHQHRIEIPIPALDKGYYVILFLSGEQANEYAQKAIASGNVWVSDIAYTARHMEHGGVEVLITDRNTGKALESAIIRVFYRQYDYRARKLNLIPGPVFTSDKNGFARIQVKSGQYEHHPATLSISYKNDLLSTDDQYYLQTGTIPEPRIREQCFLFTDRAVYRPGQVIYYKGILFSSDGKKHELVVKKPVKLKLMDANGRTVSEQTQTTGKYGSFHGTFTAPAGVLLGNCQLVCDYGQVSVLIEEYKRPRFEVTFEPIQGEFKLGDEVQVTGSAMGYTGDPLGASKVRYRIERSAWYPYPWYGDWGIRPGRSSQLISSGETFTAADGTFSVQFIALGSPEISTRFKPFYRFVVYADVVDMSGETRHGQTSLNVGKQSLIIQSEIPRRMEKNQGHSYKVSVRNNQDQAVAVNLDLRIYRLEEPARLLRKREWSQPDLHYLDKAAFVQRFPYDPYEGEDDPLSWNRIEPFREKTYNTGVDSLLNLNTFTALPEGVYLLELSCVDKSGDTVRRQDVIELYPESARKPLFNQHLWTHLTKDEAKPGETVKLLLSAAHPEARVWVEISNKKGLKESKWHSLGRATKSIPIPVGVDDKGGMIIRCISILNNRQWLTEHRLAVVDDDLKLNVSFERFRNKLEPGQSEEWTIRFRSNKGEPATPEVLLAMYDASLDAIAPHNWYFNLPSSEIWRAPWGQGATFGIRSGMTLEPYLKFTEPLRNQEYDKLNWFGMHFWGGRGYGRGIKTGMMVNEAMPLRSLSSYAADAMDASAKGEMEEQEEAAIQTTLPQKEKPLPGLEMRKNLGETAFFMPNLQADSKGDILVKFKAPEALTRWKVLGFAHTLGLSHALFQEKVITARELMVVPNLPIILYEGDEIWLKTKVVNAGMDTLAGVGSLEIEDAISGESAESLMDMTGIKTTFKVDPVSADTLIWRIKVPVNAPSLLRIRIKASTNTSADGEEHLIPVLSSRVLVTETLPLFLPGKGEKQWDFDALARSLSDKGITGHRMSLEYTLQPAWNVVKAIPSMVEKGGNSSHEIFTRLFANTMGSHIISNNPVIATVIQTWATHQPSALESMLTNNQDLKAVVIEETPWVRDAAAEKESRQQLAVFLDKNTLTHTLETDATRLCALQLGNGAWPWFPGMQPSRHMTQQILSGIGKLRAMGATPEPLECLSYAAQKASSWVIGMLETDLEDLKRLQPKQWQDHIPTAIQIQAIYALSFFMDGSKLKGKEAEAWNFYFDRSAKNWTSFSLHLQGLYGFAALRTGRLDEAKRILASLTDRALIDQDGGMYWKGNAGGYRWYEAPIETQALLIGFFTEAKANPDQINAMKIWLLRHKQVNRWKTNTATAEACYAILQQSSEWIGKRSGIVISLGNLKIEPDKTPDLQQEAGSGYFRKDFAASEISHDMRQIKVSTTNQVPSWGAVYWQYFQEMSEVFPQQAGLSLRKTLALIRETNQGQVLIPYRSDQDLLAGDRLRVRLEIETARDMEYVHLQDHRPAAMERVIQRSGYRYQGGLGWYESIRDAGTDIFIEFLSKGNHVIEYDLFATQEGNFSSGPARIQSLYAPEFSAHSGGMRVRIKGGQ